MKVSNKLKQGDKIRVIAPARSMDIISEDQVGIARENFIEMGLKVEFAEHVYESTRLGSPTIKQRVKDLHDAFADDSVDGIITIIGGHHSNVLLPHLDFDLIADNPKVFCGYSDPTALLNAIYTKTGLTTYYGPHFSTFGAKKFLDYTTKYFQKCLMSEEPYEIQPSKKWSDDDWHLDQENRELMDNPGFEVIYKGEAEGEIVGGCLAIFNHLIGTDYMPDLSNKILFIEDDFEEDLNDVNCLLASLSQQPGFEDVRGIVIGRFQQESDISRDDVRYIIEKNKLISDIPVVYGVDFGHTQPKFTFPIGGEVKMKVTDDNVDIKINKH